MECNDIYLVGKEPEPRIFLFLSFWFIWVELRRKSLLRFEVADMINQAGGSTRQELMSQAYVLRDLDSS